MEKPGGFLVAPGGQFHADNVVRAAPQQLQAFALADYVIGRADHLVEGAGDVHVGAQASKGQELWHGT